MSVSAASSTRFCKQFQGCDLNNASLTCVYLALQSLAFFESSVSERIVVAHNWFNAPLQMSTTDAIFFPNVLVRKI